MVNAINWMIYLSEGKKYYSAKTKTLHRLHLNFITLTLCADQFHSDAYIKERMLEPFLKWMKRKGNDLYVWRAETQANGNIHFHITSNRYIDYKSIRNKWNSLLEKHGYLKKFFDRNGHHDPNSTDVKGVRNPAKMAAYMVKYMSKEDKTRRAVTCKVWSCSTALMNKRRSITQESKFWDKYFTVIDAKCKKVSVSEYTVYEWPSKKLRNKILEQVVIDNAKDKLSLIYEKFCKERIPGRLGAIKPRNKTEGSIHLPALRSQTERTEVRQARLFQSDH